MRFLGIQMGGKGDHRRQECQEGLGPGREGVDGGWVGGWVVVVVVFLGVRRILNSSLRFVF